MERVVLFLEFLIYALMSYQEMLVIGNQTRIVTRVEVFVSLISIDVVCKADRMILKPGENTHKHTRTRTQALDARTNINFFLMPYYRTSSLLLFWSEACFVMRSSLIILKISFLLLYTKERKSYPSMHYTVKSV